MPVPVITTAIPKRRYQLGEFLVTVLGDIESGDGAEYRYILAVSREGDPQPGLFVALDRNDGSAGDGKWRMQVMMAEGAQALGAADKWQDLDTFCSEALTIVQKMMALEDEEPYQLA